MKNSTLAGLAGLMLVSSAALAFAEDPPRPPLPPGHPPVGAMPPAPPLPPGHPPVDGMRPPRGMAMAMPATRAGAEALAADHFAAIDADGDGFVTRAEADAAGRGPAGDDSGAKARLDTNGDGTISRAEFEAVHGAGAAPGAGDMPRRPPPPGGPGGRAGPPPMMAGPLFDTIDANHDGRIDRAEAIAAGRRHFDRMDVDRDGRLSDAERTPPRPPRPPAPPRPPRD